MVLLRVAVRPGGGRAALDVASYCGACMPARSRTPQAPSTTFIDDGAQLVAPHRTTARSGDNTRFGCFVQVRELFAIVPWPRRASRLGGIHDRCASARPTGGDRVVD